MSATAVYELRGTIGTFTMRATSDVVAALAGLMLIEPPGRIAAVGNHLVYPYHPTRRQPPLFAPRDFATERQIAADFKQRFGEAADEQTVALHASEIADALASLVCGGGADRWQIECLNADLSAWNAPRADADPAVADFLERAQYAARCLRDMGVS